MSTNRYKFVPFVKRAQFGLANNNTFFVKAEIASFSPIGVWLAFLNDFPSY